CFDLFLTANEHGPHGNIIGNWQPPIDIQYNATMLNSFTLLAFSTVNFIIFPFAYISAENEIPRPRIPLFYACLMLAVSGLFGMIISIDIFNIYVFLEISSLLLYALIALGRGKEALTCTFNYLVI